MFPSQVSAAFTLTVAFALIGADNAYARESSRFSTPKRFAAGIDVNAQPSVEETGLPLYPGAVAQREGHDDDGVNLKLWFGSYGLNLVVMKLKSSDPAGAVEAFYRDALNRYGEVLDCSDTLREGSVSVSARGTDKKSTVLTCSDRQIKKAGLRQGKLYKTGSRAKQYGVAVQSDGDGTTFQLFHFEKRSGDHD